MGKKTKQMQRQVTILNMFLGLEFLLGVLLTSVVGYDHLHPTVMQVTILVMHIIVGTGIVIAGALWLFYVRRQPKLRTFAIGGLLSVVIAFFSGSYATRTHSTVATVLEAVFFIVAFILYGFSSALTTGERPSAKNTKIRG